MLTFPFPSPRVAPLLLSPDYEGGILVAPVIIGKTECNKMDEGRMDGWMDGWVKYEYSYRGRSSTRINVNENERGAKKVSLEAK